MIVTVPSAFFPPGRQYRMATLPSGRPCLIDADGVTAFVAVESVATDTGWYWTPARQTINRD